MSLADILSAVFLGLVEGLTEFIPVSSTGHLILLIDLLGFRGPPGKVFEVMIQLGAILAVCVVYFEKLWGLFINLPRAPTARRFAAGIVVAFLPAAILGASLHGFIKGVLFSPWVVCAALIVGGIVILVIERRLPPPRHHESDGLPPLLCLKIGLFQALALVPGVSRSGATIIGALLLGVERRAAAEFSFFLAIPTMLGAFIYDAYKNWANIQAAEGGMTLIATGFIAAFLAALVIVRGVLGFIARHGFAPFAWYRIALGSLIGLFLWFS